MLRIGFIWGEIEEERIGRERDAPEREQPFNALNDRDPYTLFPNLEWVGFLVILSKL